MSKGGELQAAGLILCRYVINDEYVPPVGNPLFRNDGTGVSGDIGHASGALQCGIRKVGVALRHLRRVVREQPLQCI